MRLGIKPSSLQTTIKSNENNLKKITKEPITPSNKFYYISVLYLLLILIDVVLVYDNEYKRPKIERLYSSIDYIEASIINNQIEDLNQLIEK